MFIPIAKHQDCVSLSLTMQNIGIIVSCSHSCNRHTVIAHMGKTGILTRRKDLLGECVTQGSREKCDNGVPWHYLDIVKSVSSGVSQW
jgi:hypothetical protein